MKIVFVGTGVAVFSKKRCSPCIIIELNGNILVFDCGPGSMRNATLLGYDTKEIEHVFITHLHLDHVADLIPLVKERGLTTRKRLIVCGPPGLRKYLQNETKVVFPYLDKLLESWKFLKVCERKKGLVTRIGSCTISCTPTRHANGIGYKIDNDGFSVLYSGDTTYDENLVEFGRDVDLAILECSYPSKEELKGLHLSPEGVGILASKMNAKRVALTHLYPECNGREEEMKRRIREYFRGEVIIPNDGDVIEL